MDFPIAFVAFDFGNKYSSGQVPISAGEPDPDAARWKMLSQGLKI